MTTFAIVQNGSDPRYGPLSLALIDAETAEDALVEYLAGQTLAELKRHVRTTEDGAEVEHAGVHYSAVPRSNVPVKP